MKIGLIELSLILYHVVFFEVMIFQLVLIVEPLDAISLGANDFRTDETLHNLKLKIEILNVFTFFKS
jgi:hypothetical protein